ncbi:C-reactive protein 1.1-like [Centruroides sculpturatus]|uniref:C-reactive protein 1.1-like n=1 Tax=Centruroides sculpturatus TaxID=218467 RepID=UPI000C6E1B00|nr:C-reactive protein 1.1-like [Centruroides sculpturatus]
MSHLRTLLIILLNGFCTARFTKVHFEAPNLSNYPRLRLLGTLPTLTEFTLCSWIKSPKNGTLLSYRTSTSDRFLVTISGANVETTIGSESIKLNCENYKKGYWNHLCIVWTEQDGRLRIFMNEKICDVASRPQIASGGRIHEGGTLVIGQYQHDTDLKFDPDQAWVGDIAILRLWDEVLTFEQIVKAGKCNGHLKDGNIITLMKTPMSAMDGVIFSKTDLCE